MNKHILFFLGPPEAREYRHASAFAESSSHSSKVIWISKELSEMEMFPAEHEYISQKFVRKSHYGLARMREEVLELVETDRYTILIFTGFPTSRKQLFETFGVIRESGIEGIKIDFIFLNDRMEEAERRLLQDEGKGSSDTSDVSFSSRWKSFHDKKEQLIAVAREFKEILDINIVQIDASGKDSEVQSEIKQELANRVVISEQEVISIPRPELTYPY